MCGMEEIRDTNAEKDEKGEEAVKEKRNSLSTQNRLDFNLHLPNKHHSSTAT